MVYQKYVTKYTLYDIETETVFHEPDWLWNDLLRKNRGQLPSASSIYVSRSMSCWISAVYAYVNLIKHN